jgi:hypothetical protein
VGCRFDSHVSGSQFFTVNPDRRRRLLNTQVGDALCVFVCVCVCEQFGMSKWCLERLSAA